MIIHTSEIAISKLPQVQLDSTFPFQDIVHMVLAGGPSQTLYNVTSGSHERAVDYLCRNAKSAIADDERGRPYFVFDRPERLNETLGVLAVSEVHFARTPILTSLGNSGNLEDLAEAAMKSFRDDSGENSWSLMLFSAHPGVTSEWLNDSGELQSVERILRAECSRPYGEGSCFGTHRLEGIAFAIRRFCLQEDVEPSQLNGVWSDAYEYLLGAVRRIQKNQRDDGSLQRSWFRKKSFPTGKLEWKQTLLEVASFKERDAHLVYATGHCLDAISAIGDFLGDEKEWIQRACYILAQTIEARWTSVGRNIGSLTHAIHALKLLDV